MHDAILRSAIESGGGSVFSTMGDGMGAVFAGPEDGIAAAVAAQLALDRQSWSETGPLRVRMALHAGPAEQREGDYFGPTLNRCARLMSIAHGGQILLSGTAEPLVRDGLSAGLELLDLGEHRLRDLSRPEHVFQLLHPQLRREFPALRSQSVLRGNLPWQATSFVGRTRAVDELVGRVGERRLVTLIGAGGVGKTRLALEAAAAVSPKLRDGAWLCELAPLQNADAVCDTVAATFGVMASEGRDLDETLVEFLATKQLLLLLDNCEHLTEPVAEVIETILAKCPGVALLATSRERLGVAGEQSVSVPPLDVPGEKGDAGLVIGSEAAQLFVERARAVKPDFGVTAENAAAIAEVCRRLDGVPLALELAAGRVNVLSPRELVHRLDQRFALLASTDRRVDRHQTLRATIDWSYELLDEPERRLLAWLGVFVGGATLEAVEDICSAPGSAGPDVLALVSSLAGRSLVVVDDASVPTRYRLLETIREYALERLNERGETEAARDRHARFFVDLAQRAASGLRSPDEAAWLPLVARDVENLRAALSWVTHRQDTDLALRMLSATKQLPFFFLPAGRALHAGAQPVLQLPGVTDDPRLVAALITAAAHAQYTGNFEQAQRLAEQAVEAEQRFGSGPDVYVLGPMTDAALAEGRIDEAIELTERFVAIDRAKSDTAELAFDLGFLGMIRVLGGGDQHQAAIEATEGLQLARQCGVPSVIANTLQNLGFVLADTEPQQARALLREGIELAESLGQGGEANAVAMEALVATRLGDHHEAIELSHHAIDQFGWALASPVLGSILEILAHALAHQHRPEPAAVLQGALDTLAPGYARYGQIADIRADTTEVLAGDLGDARTEELRRRGSTMDQNQALDYARAQINETFDQTELRPR
jgi:predicted ATPase